MTDTLSRPARTTAARSPAQAGPPRRRLEAGVTGAVWAGCAGLVAVALPVLLVWAADARSGAGAAAALRAAGQVWLVAHGVGLAVPGGHLGLVPLGLLALPFALLLRAGGHGARECQIHRLNDAALLAVALAVPYALLTAVVAAVATSSSVHPETWQALLCGAVVGGLGGFAGAVRGAGLTAAVLPALPERGARLIVATAGALALLTAAGALLSGGALLAHLGRAGDLAAATAPGRVGGLALLLLGLLLVPNAAVWGVSWLAGPGFHVGVGTAVGPYGTALGPVPSLPLLAALPGPVPAWAGLLGLGVVLAAGALAGLLVVRRLDAPSWQVAGREAALVGPCAGAVAALAGWLAGGPVGGGRLTDVGPSPWQLGLSVAAEVAVGAAAAAAVAARRLRA
jgi:hypothetical protein